MWRRIFFLLAVSSVQAINGKCRVLAIGGSTEFGAYEGGAIIGLINNLPAGEAQWDVVAGIGLGALNGLIVSNYPLGSEAQAAAKLNSFWTSFTYGSIYSDWVGGLITGLTLESGLYDSTPLKRTIKTLTPTKFQRWLAVGAADLISGYYVSFNSSAQTVANMQTGILASMSQTPILPVVVYNKLQLVSGDMRFSLNIFDAVNACFALKYPENAIVVDVVLGAGYNVRPVNATDYKSLQVFLRALELVGIDSYIKVVLNIQEEFPDATIRTQIFPSQDLNRTLYPYDFTPNELAQQLSLGEKDAMNAIPKEIFVNI